MALVARPRGNIVNPVKRAEFCLMPEVATGFAVYSGVLNKRILAAFTRVPEDIAHGPGLVSTT
jgi:hypothetical protein